MTTTPSSPLQEPRARYSLQKAASATTSDACTELLNQLVLQNKIREIDRGFALFVLQQVSLSQDSERALLVMVAALLSEQLGQQQVCLKIESIRQPFASLYTFPPAREIMALFERPELAQSDLFEMVDERLYLARYRHYEQQIATRLSALSAPEFPFEIIGERLMELYPGASDDAQPDWQKTAVALACLRSVAVIAGGPGTGKTTTVVRILWMLSQLSRQTGKANPIIKMVAPTGKAAARLSESVAGAISKLPDKDNNIPAQCSTIHRLLGTIPGSNFFRHDERHPLNIDVLVVDEASMIDMPLLAKLLVALPKHCRLILLGDSHQLASVEVGSVFSDICSLKQGSNQFSVKVQAQLCELTLQPQLTGQDYCAVGIADNSFVNNIIYLLKSWRFDANSGVGQLAYAINSGDVAQTLQALNSDLDDIQWNKSAEISQFIRAILPHFESFHLAVESGEVAQAFEVLAQWQVLAVQRSGKWGTLNLNLRIYQALRDIGKITLNSEFYPGRPIMITSNDYQNRLFNGDIGIVMQDESNENLLKVWFADAEQGFRSLLPAQLPAHETLYAMTTHKSQGSEFENVLMCLPESQPGLTGRINRELLYTGVTRARKRFVLFADEQAVKDAVRQQCQRASGLAQTLQQ